MKTRCILFLLLIVSIAHINAQESPLWMRNPKISPDGKTIVFCYKGDLYTIGIQGGQASQLTTHPEYDCAPVWSHDSKTIAFASNRNGNFDIYTVPANGGNPKRITYWSYSDFPETFSPDDKNIYYRTTLLPDRQYAQFPAFGTIYTIPTDGGRPQLFSSILMKFISLNDAGTQMLYQDTKGYEDTWRKHHTSSVTCDIWLYDIAKREYTQITRFEGENREPVFMPNNNRFCYYLNEKSGSLNIYKRDIENQNETQITFYRDNPVRGLSISRNGTLCYTYNGELYLLKPNEQPLKVSILIKRDETAADYKISFEKGGITDMDVAPSGKEIAFIIRGDVYVTSAEYETTKRITDTPEQERDVAFSLDGRKLAYSSERNGSWQVYATELVRDDDEMFTYAHELKETQITHGDKACFQPAFSPDGKEIAFLYDRQTLQVLNLKNNKIRTVLEGKYNYSYTDGDQWYQWSPDGKWFLANYFETGGMYNTDIGMVKADGSGEIHNLTQSGYSDFEAKWAFDGKAMTWTTDKNGYRSHGGWGAENDIYIMFFDKACYDKFLMNKEEAALEKEAEKKKDKEKNKKNSETKDSTEITLPEIEYDIENAEDRVVRMTITSAYNGDYYLSKEGDKLYYFVAFEKGYDLWMHDFKENTTKLLAKLGTSYAFLDADREKKNLFMLAKGKISKIKLEDGSTKPVPINAEYTYRPDAERDYIFHHVWQQVEDKFYDPTLHGVDWKKYGDNYARFLPYINNNFDFAEMLGEMLGELNASHTGARYYAPSSGDKTAVFGMFFDTQYEGDGLKIVEILNKNPMIKAGSTLKPGVIITKIDGNDIKAGEDYFRFLNHKAGKNTLLTLSNGRKTWEEQVKPLSLGTQNELLYQRWVKQREHLVDSLSQGQIGYVHVRGMNSSSYRKVYSDILGKNRNKKAIVVDTRFNGGGWLHDDLATLLNGKRYVDFVPRGQYVASEPLNKWTKPSVVVVNESNYSDAYGFPYTYKVLNIGKLVGMPVAGTMTAVWWERQIDRSLVFGIPEMGVKNMDGEYLENKQLEPDIKVNNTPGSMVAGRDLQIEAAVQELLRQVQ